MVEFLQLNIRSLKLLFIFSLFSQDGNNSLTKIGKIAFITLNRPDKLNAIELSMPANLKLAVETANDDEDVHVIIISGKMNKRVVKKG